MFKKLNSKKLLPNRVGLFCNRSTQKAGVKEKKPYDKTDPKQLQPNSMNPYQISQP
jgi:hypothetical protein